MKTAHWAFLLPILTAGALSCGGGEDEPVNPKNGASATTARTGTRVEVVELIPSTGKMEMSLLGSVEASRDAMLSTTRGGYVESVFVKAGDPVSKGALLANVDSELHRVLLEQATAQSDLAEAEYKRAVGLGDLIAESQLQAAETQMAVAQAGLKQAQLNLARAQVRAPFTGQVGSVHVEAGEVVGPGRPVIRLVALRKVKVGLNVADRDVVSLRRGMPVKIRLQAVSERFEGQISSIAPVADIDTRSFQVEVTVDNPKRNLLPGMIARVELARDMEQSAVLIPQDWIVTGLEEEGVYLANGDTANWRPVVLGDVVRDQVVVSTGLAVGDRIIIAGHRNLADGDAILIAREGRCCDAGRALF
jgi:membrane fusion protein (multidrug efflux system)